jgi:fluoroquinolone resistance protein
MTATFHDQDLTGADFANADLAAATFQGCTLTGANFRHADLTEALFVGCRAFPKDDPGVEDAEPVDFSYATLTEARFERCDLTTALFCNASAYDLSLDQCQIQGADFSSCDFSLPIRGAATLAGFRMTNCNFAFGDLSNTYLKDCVLTGNRMIDALAHNCSLSGADLSGSDLNGLTGQGLDLSGADLRGARFNTLDPRQVNLAGVRMGLAQGLAILDQLEIVIDPDTS